MLQDMALMRHVSSIEKVALISISLSTESFRVSLALLDDESLCVSLGVSLLMESLRVSLALLDDCLSFLISPGRWITPRLSRCLSLDGITLRVSRSPRRHQIGDYWCWCSVESISKAMFFFLFMSESFNSCMS